MLTAIKTKQATGVRIHVIELWVKKESKTVKEYFRILHRYEKFCLLKGKHFNFTANIFDIKRNSENNPVLMYY